MAVVDTSRIQFDMDAVFENDGTIDFNMGLDADEKREKAVADKIQYGKIEAGQIAAKYVNSGDTVQTATPGKETDGGTYESEDDTIAKSVKTYNVDTTVGSEKDKDGSLCSISSDETLESVNMTDRRDVSRQRPRREQCSRLACCS